MFILSNPYKIFCWKPVCKFLLSCVILNWCLFVCSYFPYRATSSSELFITLPGMGEEGEWGRRCGRGRLGGTAPAYAWEDHGNHENHDQGSRPWELNPRSTECQTGVLTTRPPMILTVDKLMVFVSIYNVLHVNLLSNYSVHSSKNCPLTRYKMYNKMLVIADKLIAFCC